MHLDPYIILGGAVVGLLVGMTGAGGGALMTPMLILLFGVTPSSAISSDLVAAVLMRPLGAIVHMRAGTVNFRLVRWLVTGSVPAAFLGSYLLHLMHNSSSTQTNIEYFLGGALLIGAAAMGLRFVIDAPFGARGRRGGGRRYASIAEIDPRPVPTLIVGIVGGVIVGMTSVGSGSLMVVALLFLYPQIGAGQLVGTDLTQAVPLTLAAACGAILFGHVEFGITGSLIIGSVPAVFLGSLLSSSVPDRYVRPVIAFAIYASGLKYVQVPTQTLGWVLCATLLLCGGAWLIQARPWNRLPADGRAGPAAQTPPAVGRPALAADSPPSVLEVEGIGR